MSNVIALHPKARPARKVAGPAALVPSFANFRRGEEDVFWLKENAELLNILECTGTALPAQALEPLGAFYESAETRLSFFPQYYRFLLSIVLDLEDLGMSGERGARMAGQVARTGCAAAELSDLQRMEARRLLARRGQVGSDDPGLADRLRAFCAGSQIFALPNKKAAYELTHIVFYLSEYGRRDPHLSAEAVTSLYFAGNLAFLEQNSDLLAEICIALRYTGEEPPALWTAWLGHETRRFEVSDDSGGPLADDYHDYLVCNWHASVEGQASFAALPEAGRLTFRRGMRMATPLRELSEALFAQGEARKPDWTVTRRQIGARLSPETLHLVDEMAGNSRHFDAFFEGFARAGNA